MFRMVGQAAKCTPGGLFHRPFLVAPYFSGCLKNGQEFGLMVDGDEFCWRLCENGGRKNVDSVLAGLFFATSATWLWTLEHCPCYQGATAAPAPPESAQLLVLRLSADGLVPSGLAPRRIPRHRAVSLPQIVEDTFRKPLLCRSTNECDRARQDSVYPQPPRRTHHSSWTLSPCDQVRRSPHHFSMITDAGDVAPHRQNDTSPVLERLWLAERDTLSEAQLSPPTCSRRKSGKQTFRLLWPSHLRKEVHILFSTS